MPYYLDTSAAVKLVVTETETAALKDWLIESPRSIVASDLLRTELLRATRRGAPEMMIQARAVLDSVTLLAVTTETFERAAELDPTLLRSLDAIHLASAIQLGDELEGLLTYDDRLVEAAQLHGITAIAPGRPHTSDASA